MIKIEKPIVVEGKYDQIKLSSFIDTLIVPVGGFGIFKDKQKQEYIRSLAGQTGIILLTDSDSAGFMLRRFITDIAGGENVIQAYIPDVFGKEKRKAKASSEGKLGVEGVSRELIIAALERAGVKEGTKLKNEITHALLFELGLSGGTNSKQRRKVLTDRLQLPERLNTASLIKTLNLLMTKEQLKTIIKEIDEETT